jgi:hypothetical protein
MKAIFILLLFIACSTPNLLADSATPYIGDWSNMRGHTLKISATTIQFLEDEPVPYKDVTRVSDGNYFQLELKTKDSTNFLGKIMLINMKGKNEMSMDICNSENEYSAGNYSSVNWFRD